MPQKSKHANYPYDIKKLVSVDRVALSVTAEAAHSDNPLTAFMLRVDHPGFAAGAVPPVYLQIFERCVNSIAGRPGGTWRSFQSLKGNLKLAGRLAEQLIGMGVSDLNDEHFTLSKAGQALTELNVSTTSVWRGLLSGAVSKTGRADSQKLAFNITQLPLPELPVSGTTAFKPGQGEAVLSVAKNFVKQGVKDYQKILTGLDFDLGAEHWWTINAQRIIAAADARDQSRSRPVKPFAWQQLRDGYLRDRFSDDECVDWMILNPKKLPSPAPRALSYLRDLFAALYPDYSCLAAAAVVHCMAGNKGLNLSVITSVGASNITHVGMGVGIEANAKARNRTRNRRGINLVEGLGNEDGIHRTLIGWTALSRHHRTASLGAEHELADKFYVQTEANPQDTTLLRIDTHDAAPSFFGQELVAKCAEQKLEVPSVSFRQLRLFAQGRASRDAPFDVTAGVVDHTPRQKIHYLKQCLGDRDYNALSATASNEITDIALEALLSPVDTQRLDDDTAIDMKFNTCVSGRKDPDDSDRPCDLGVAACFTCPNGYRTKAHVPGLIAVVRSTGRLLKLPFPAPHEIHALNHYAKRTLDVLDEATVEEAKNDPQMDTLITLIDHLLTERRRAS
mgnify:CR=1 FL=1